ncbi:MAG TPA: 16S rRNA (guanine(966)-N(2))-methyltransferase RsmD [Candidatus Saccharimonadales bacterium]|nr:16S rRNA (guanine(966)-N(2))-methyltransferase RsmD [Candidatus Saccharimonadales bacterium]
MKIRLITGAYGGRFLDAPKSSRTHPMSERVRASLFNQLGDLAGKTILDAFAGTGALGLEALSRGADSAVLIERDKLAQKVLAGNIDSLAAGDRAKLIRSSVSAWTDTAKDQKFDLIFADPPYHDLQLSTVAKLVNYLQANGLMILSFPGRESAPTVNGVVVVDNRSYGDAALAFYRLDRP